MRKLQMVRQTVKDFIRRKIINIVRKRTGSLKTPMDVVFLTLQVHKLLPKPLIALEVFGMHGLWVAYDYAHLCDYLELWEIEPIYAKFARKFIPKAVVKIGDSIKAVKEKRLLRENYNFIVIDNPLWSPYGPGYCEHFDLFPDVFGYLGKSGVLVMNVIPDIGLYASTLSKKQIPQEWIDRRKEFYGINEDKGVINLDVKKMVDIYKDKVPKGDFIITNTFLVPKNTYVGFLVMAIKRNSKEHPV